MSVNLCTRRRVLNASGATKHCYIRKYNWTDSLEPNEKSRKQLEYVEFSSKNVKKVVKCIRDSMSLKLGDNKCSQTAT